MAWAGTGRDLQEVRASCEARLFSLGAGKARMAPSDKGSRANGTRGACKLRQIPLRVSVRQGVRKSRGPVLGQALGVPGPRLGFLGRALASAVCGDGGREVSCEGLGAMLRPWSPFPP